MGAIRAAVMRALAATLGALVAGLLGCGPPGESCPPVAAAVSDDPDSSRQWYLSALGVPEAWEAAGPVPREEVLVAVVDNGFDVSHPDLGERLWSSADGGPGWNLLEDGADLTPAGDTEARLGHGTAVAGLVGAAHGNGLGVAGVCPSCRLMLLKARDFGAVPSSVPRLEPVVRFAVERGARILVISDGLLSRHLSDEELASVQRAMADAEASGLLVVASAGNDARDEVRWPARIVSVLAVAATDRHGRPLASTSFGVEVDVAAPGECAYTTLPEGRYGYFAGTSASAPIVAGLAGLLLSAAPELTAEQLIDRIRSTARPVDVTGRPELAGRFGAGLVDFAAAVQAQ